MKLTAAGTGQRPQHMRPEHREYGRAEVTRVLGRLRAEWGIEVVCSGMALGFDQWLATDAVRLGMELHAYLPFPAEHQSSRWTDVDRAAYLSLLELASYTQCEADGFDFEAYSRRNQSLVDAADVMIVMTNGKRGGGTWDCIRRIVDANSLPSILIHTGEAKTVHCRDGEALARAVKL